MVVVVVVVVVVLVVMVLVVVVLVVVVEGKVESVAEGRVAFISEKYYLLPV